MSSNEKIDMNVYFNLLRARLFYNHTKNLWNYMESNNIKYAYIKGEALSLMAYGNNNQREYGDVDILIPINSVKSVNDFLLESNFKQEYPTTNFKTKREYDIFSMLNSHQAIPYIREIKGTENYFEIDINKDIYWGEYSGKRVDIEEFLSDTIDITVFNCNIKTLTPLKTMIQLLLHHYRDMNSIYLLATRNSIKYSMFKDVYYLLKNNQKKITCMQLYEISTIYQIVPYVYYVLYYTKKVFNDDIFNESFEKSWSPSLPKRWRPVVSSCVRQTPAAQKLCRIWPAEALIKTTKSMQRRPAMRLLKLRIENINSLAGRYEIDFTNRDYVESGIFAIVGPTGSGKTTILDAVTLALFGKTPRMETRTSTSKKTDRGCMVLTEGRKQCSASVVFESMGKFWRSRWSVRLKRTGEPRDAQVELVRLPDGSAETGEIVAEQKLAWNAKVPEVLGMDYETFTRSALLAQGAFTELLRAQVDDRAAILEKITGTKLYSTIGQWVFERCRDENNKVKRLLVHLEGAEMLAEDARKALDKYPP